MAKKTTVTLIDDLDESVAAETVEFSLGRDSYEIDLSEPNAARLREGLAEFIAQARVVRGTRKSGSAASSSTAARNDRDETRAIRAWAKENGFPDLADRGRVPGNVREAYQNRNRVWPASTGTVTPIRPTAMVATTPAASNAFSGKALADAAAAAVNKRVENGDDASDFVEKFVDATRKHADVKAAAAAAKAKAPTKAKGKTSNGLPKVAPKPKGVKVTAMTGMQTAAVEDMKIPTHEVGKSFVIFQGDSPVEVLAAIRSAMQGYDGSKTSGAYAAMKAVVRKLESADPKQVKIVEVEAA